VFNSFFVEIFQAIKKILKAISSYYDLPMATFIGNGLEHGIMQI